METFRTSTIEVNLAHLSVSGSVIFLFGGGIVFALPICTCIFLKECERSQSITYFHSCNHITLLSRLRYWPLITDIMINTKGKAPKKKYLIFFSAGSGQDKMQS